MAAHHTNPYLVTGINTHSIDTPFHSDGMFEFRNTQGRIDKEVPQEEKDIWNKLLVTPGYEHNGFKAELQDDGFYRCHYLNISARKVYTCICKILPIRMFVNCRVEPVGGFRNRDFPTLKYMEVPLRDKTVLWFT